jgi:predicted DCC family thiol-disulfide oxidoreductase YuxK
VNGAPALDGLWLFDGVCNFCSGSVKTALALDREGVLRFTPLQSPFGQAIAARYGLDLENPESFLFFDRGRPLGASDAVLALAQRLGPAWSALAAILRPIPRRWRDTAYGLLARNRYRLLGKRDTCMIPTPEQRARFVLEPPAGWPGG